MNSIINSNYVLLIILVINLILMILYILDNIKLNKLRKSYSDFMCKLGKGENIYEDLKKYISKVEKIEDENKEIEKYCEVLKNKTDGCMYKIGLIRYNAYKDTGSNLSFALALLNEKNDGIVLNGIYARDSSNIYCKTVKNGLCEYAISIEEQDAINEAIKFKLDKNNEEGKK